MTDSPKTNSLVRALLLAALFLGVTASLTLLPIDAGMVKRVVGVMTGAMVVFYSNYAPKKLTPLAAMRCNPATEQALRRFTGMSMVLGGLGYMLVWMFVPLEWAVPAAVAVLGGALLLVVIRFLVAATHPAQD